MRLILAGSIQYFKESTLKQIKALHFLTKICCCPEAQFSGKQKFFGMGLIILLQFQRGCHEHVLEKKLLLEQ